MQIIHKIDDFLYTIFPSIKKGDNDIIIDTLEKYYTYGLSKPKVSIDREWIKIEIDTPEIISQEFDFKKIVKLCEKGNYSEAKPILKKLIENNPTKSEYHRIMGQMLSDEGDQDAANKHLIDALRWDSKNGWALIMMGNIFAKFRDDIPTAMKYYDQAIIANPKDNIAISNIGANLMQQGKLKEAKKYFGEAIKINDQFPNTYFALGMIAEMENDLHSAFYNTIQAIKLNKNKDGLYKNSVRQSFEIAKRVIGTDQGKKIFEEYRQKMEFEGGREIGILEDYEIPTAAKFEFAENYDRSKHIIKFKPNYPAVEHLIMHELVHLAFANEARKKGINQLFISNQNHKTRFIKNLKPAIKKFNKMGISDKSVADYCLFLFDGLNRQIFNTPIDLFIENFLYSEYAELRPYQFLSLYDLVQEGLKAVTDKKIVKLSPKDIISKSKIYNIVSAIQFKELYGFDFIKDFRATPRELRLANDFYEEYLQNRKDKEPAKEYELILSWAMVLKIDRNFELVNEHEHRTKKSYIDDLLSSIEEDAYDSELKDPYKKKETEKFQKSQQSIETNMAVVMLMVDALQFFDGMPKEEIKKISFEIAMQGTQGYNPDKDDYRISSIEGKTFSGYHILAYYYVSWSLAMPEMVSQLNLPYDEEYKLANTLHKSKTND